MPALTKVHIELDTVRRAMDNPRIIGLKDSSGDLNYFRGAAELIRQHRPDWPLLCGPEEKLLATLQLGGNGGVSGGANLFPKLYVKLCEAHRAGNLARAEELQKQIQRVSDSFYRIGKYSSSIIKGIKCVASTMGLCNDFMAEPFHKFRAEERQLVKARLEEIQIEINHLNL
jgi:4-hydroxy-tetrahydrodipicolinate synthase